jgi:hypothetical protein
VDVAGTLDAVEFVMKTSAAVVTIAFVGAFLLLLLAAVFQR